jgi:ATP phosphoribosyltransferase/ATP phosphoribosyltransferase regulatory subunit
VSVHPAWQRLTADAKTLTAAVPRGVLMDDSLDMLDSVGFDTSEVRANPRKHLFEEAGIITMRPSDIPIYVAARAADIGITGKDVLMEHPECEVYELADLEFGGATLVVASPDEEPDPAEEALRRHGVVRVGTKYPTITRDYYERAGRQVEIVEVRGAVELAAVSRLTDAIVDLTATGTTLRENDLVVRDELVRVSARLIANPSTYTLKVDALQALLGKLGG